MIKGFIVPAFPLSGESNYVLLRSSVLNVSVLLSRGTITSPPKLRRVVGIPYQIFIERTPTPYLV